MKNFFILFLILIFSVENSNASNDGKVQCGIFATGNVLTIKAKPASDYSGTFADNIIFTIRWSSTYTGVTLSEITSSFGLAKEGSAWTSGANVYQQYSTVSPTSLTWTSGSEYSLGTITVSGDVGTGTFEFALLGDAINPLTSGAGDWFVQIGGIDRTPTTGSGTGGALSEFYVASVSNVALPVELTSFTAISKGRSVELAWKTATEVNSSAFEIERNNGKEWSKVGAVDASGTSNAPKEYSYIDKLKSAVGGTISYRLKMIDNDGKFEYSKIAEVKIVPTIYALEQNYPNPFNPETKIQYSLPEDAKVTLTVYDLTGREVSRVVNEQQVAGYYEQKFGGYNFASGVYFYRIITESHGKVAFTQVKKMVMIK